MMRLYGTPPTRVIRAIWLANELGLDCELIPVDLAQGDDIRSLNPAGKVPFLVDGDAPLAMRDGKAMVAVLEDHMKDRRFLVGDRLSVADFNAAYTLDWARESGMLVDAPRLRAFVDEMYARPNAPPTIAAAFAAQAAAANEA